MQAINPPDSATQERPLSPEDLERTVIAILAAREPGLELAIHVYLGLMAGLKLEDIAATIHIAGVYTGVDNFAGGMRFFKELLIKLENMVNEGAIDVKMVLAQLSASYGGFSHA
jgi:alkylhydroperoxidase/carboxymuconolactone decarboxylase family protein YurZ